MVAVSPLRNFGAVNKPHSTTSRRAGATTTGIAARPRPGRLLRRVLADPVGRFRASLVVLAVLVAIGTAGYMLIERMNVVDALYMAITALTTVGFGEVHPLSEAGRIFTILFLIAGVGTAGWAIAAGAEVFLGDKLWANVQQRRLRASLATMEAHYIVCGYGRLGRPIVHDLRSRGEQFVVIDANPALEEELAESGTPYVIGDATQDEVLRRAGIGRAHGVVVTLDNDAENVLAVLTARELNPSVLVVARANNESATSKLRRAGADRVISPDRIGGRRLALALVQPNVHDFLEQVLSMEQLEVNVGQIRVRVGSRFAGRTVGACSNDPSGNLTILAVHRVSGEFIVSPGADRVIEAGETLIVIGNPALIARLEREEAG